MFPILTHTLHLDIVLEPPATAPAASGHYPRLRYPFHPFRDFQPEVRVVSILPMLGTGGRVG